MLTAPPLRIAPSCWAEALAYLPAEHRTIPLGTRRATTPRLALRWLRHRAAHIADQLDPWEAGPVRQWLHDHAEHEHALAILAQGGSYTFTAFDDTTRYLLTVSPAHPQGHRP
ncbi:hypothetical protein [Streptomyces sparsus]